MGRSRILVTALTKTLQIMPGIAQLVEGAAIYSSREVV